MKNNNLLLFKGMCQGIPCNKFTLDCLFDADDVDKFDISNPRTFNAAHPILWCAKVFKYEPDGDLNHIIYDFSHEVLEIVKNRTIQYIFGMAPFTSIDDKSIFLSRLNFVGGRGSRFHEERFFAPTS